MKIHEYNEMMRYLTRPQEDPSIKQLAKQGTYGELYIPKPEPMPNIQDLIREEGIQVGQQVKDGGRIQELATGGVATPKRGLVDGPGSYSFEKFEIEKINNPSDEALNEIRQIIDNLDIKQNNILGKEVKNLPKEITVEKLATQIKTSGYKRPTIAKELFKIILNEKNIKTYDNYRTEKIVTVLNDALTKNKGNTLYIKPSAAVKLLPEFEVKNVKGGGGNSMLKTYRNYISGGERIGTRAGIPVPEEIGGRKIADIVTDLDRNFLDVMGGRSVGDMKILNEIKLLDRLANENPDVSGAKLKELFEEAGGTSFRGRLQKIHPVKMGNLTEGDTGVILKQAAEEGAISNSMPDSLRKAIKRYSIELNQNRFFKQAEKYRKSNPELAYEYTKAMNLISDANMKKLGMVGAGEHALPISAINTANAAEDTYFKIDAYVDHELNDWKSKHFDQPIFRKKGLAYKYNNADKLGLSAKKKLDIQEEIMQRLDFMKKRAPELMANVTFDFSGGKFTANSSTPSILDLDEKGFKALNEKGNRVNKKFIADMPDAVKLTSTGRIASIDDKFIKPIKKFKPPVSGGTAPANLASMFKKMGSSAGLAGRTVLGKAFGWVGLDVLFYELDWRNEMSKGKTKKEAKAIAKSNATLGLYKNKEYINQLKKTAEDMGIDSRAFEKVYKMNDFLAEANETMESYNRKIKKIEEFPDQYFPAALGNMKKNLAAYEKRVTEKINKMSEDVAGQVSISKAAKTFPTPNLDQIADARFDITREDFDKPFTNIQDVALEKLKKEKQRNWGEISKRSDTDAGWLGDILNANLFNMQSIPRNLGFVKNLFDPRTSLPKLDDLKSDYQSEREALQKMSARERHLYNLNKRGVSYDQPISEGAKENLKMSHPGLGFASGGIASLTRTTPPERGPQHRGLDYLRKHGRGY